MEFQIFLSSEARYSLEYDFPTTLRMMARFQGSLSCAYLSLDMGTKISQPKLFSGGETASGKFNGGRKDLEWNPRSCPLAATAWLKERAIRAWVGRFILVVWFWGRVVFLGWGFVWRFRDWRWTGRRLTLGNNCRSDGYTRIHGGWGYGGRLEDRLTPFSLLDFLSHKGCSERPTINKWNMCALSLCFTYCGGSIYQKAFLY